MAQLDFITPCPAWFQENMGKLVPSYKCSRMKCILIFTDPLHWRYRGFRWAKETCFINARCIHKCNRCQSAGSSKDSRSKKNRNLCCLFSHIPSPLLGTLTCPFSSLHIAQRIHRTFLLYQKDCWCFPHRELHPTVQIPQKEISPYRQMTRLHPWISPAYSLLTK